MENMYKFLKGKILPAMNILYSNITIQKWGNKFFLDKQKLRGFITCTPVPQEMLQEVPLYKQV
jgi:hypothetical protein